jgi:hypothetical protein
MNRGAIVLAAACAAGLVVGGVAMAQPNKANVTVLNGHPIATSVPSMPSGGSIADLPSGVLASAKNQALAAFGGGKPSAAAGLTGPLKLSVGTGMYTQVGPVTGSLGISNGRYVGQGAALMTPKQSVATFSYVGLTNGSLYLVDCAVNGLQKADVSVNSGGTTVSSTVAAEQMHVLASFQAGPGPGATIVWIQGEGTNDFFLNSCTLHPVS